MNPVPIGIAGLGGYAAYISRLLEQHSKRENAPVKLIAACEPNHTLHAKRIGELRAAGIEVFQSFEELLTQPIDAVWLPLPIHLHLPFSRQALQAGKHVICEKPSAATIDDLDAMIAARNASGKQAAIAFQDIYEATTATMKRWILDGKIGKVERVATRALWPRDDSYYKRNAWAGKLRVGDHWVLDSPASNALAHYVMLPLFLIGPTMNAADVPTSIEAELYRANPIENFDTCALRMETESDISLLFLFTHAAPTNYDPEVVILGTRGSITYKLNQTIERREGDQVVEQISIAHNDRASIVERFANLVRGVDDPSRCVATLECTRSHLLVTNGAAEASPIHTIDPSHIRKSAGKNGHPLNVIADIEILFDKCFHTHRLPHETEIAPWTRPSNRFDLRGYKHFNGPHA